MNWLVFGNLCGNPRALPYWISSFGVTFAMEQSCVIVVCRHVGAPSPVPGTVQVRSAVEPQGLPAPNPPSRRGGLSSLAVSRQGQAFFLWSIPGFVQLFRKAPGVLHHKTWWNFRMFETQWCGLLSHTWTDALLCWKGSGEREGGKSKIGVRV